MSRDAIRGFGGKIIGWMETDNKGNMIIRNFYGQIVSKYDAQLDVTRDFYGRQLTHGNTAVAQLYNPESNPSYNK